MGSASEIVTFFGADTLARWSAWAVAIVVLGLVMVVVLRRRAGSMLLSLSSNGTVADGAASILVLASVMTLLLLGSLQLIASVGFVLGLGVGAAHLFLGTAAALGLGYWAARALVPGSSGKAWAVAACVFAGLFAVSVVVAGAFYDVSWDGNGTYQQAVLKLASGWNPMASAPPLPPSVGADFWSQVYPKGSWVQAAIIYAFTGNLEQAKAARLLLVGVNFALTFSLLLTLAPHAWRRALLFGGLIALNPIATVQVFTFMYDGEVASLLFAWLLLAGLIWTRFGRWPIVLALAATTVMLVTVKFTAPAYVVIFVIALTATAALRPPPHLKSWQPAVALVIALVVGVAFVGYSPYVTNTLQRGSPLYPIVGKGSLNLMVLHMPGDFAGKDRVTKLALSVFSTPSEAAGASMSSTPKFPFSLTVSELRPFAGPTTRVSGLGPLFAAAVVLALVAFILLMANPASRRDPWVLGLWIAELVILASALINSEAWWARYAPQLWLMPVLVAAVAVYRGDEWIRRLGYLACGFLVANALLVAGVNVASQVYATTRVTRALEEARAWEAPILLQQREFTTSWIKLSDLGIRYRVVPDDAPLPDGVQVPYLDSVISPGR